MLSLLQWFLQKIDLLKVAEFLRTRNDRSATAKLYYVLVVTYDIIDIHEILLDELQAHLNAHRNEDAPRFWINPARIAKLLSIQADNIDKLSTLTSQLYVQLRAISKDFKKVVDEVFSGKFGVLWSLSNLLQQGRLPTGDISRRITNQPNYRTLWFTWDPPSEDRSDIEKYLHGDSGQGKFVIDANTHDGEVFFRELERYLREERPFEKLKQLKDAAEELRQALETTFDVKDIISELGRVKVRRSWAP